LAICLGARRARGAGVDELITLLRGFAAVIHPTSKGARSLVDTLSPRRCLMIEREGMMEGHKDCWRRTVDANRRRGSFPTYR
jgi:hypothetical protein